MRRERGAAAAVLGDGADEGYGAFVEPAVGGRASCVVHARWESGWCVDLVSGARYCADSDFEEGPVVKIPRTSRGELREGAV